MEKIKELQLGSKAEPLGASKKCCQEFPRNFPYFLSIEYIECLEASHRYLEKASAKEGPTKAFVGALPAPAKPGNSSERQGMLNAWVSLVGYREQFVLQRCSQF